MFCKANLVERDVASAQLWVPAPSQGVGASDINHSIAVIFAILVGAPLVAVGRILIVIHIRGFEV